MSVILIKRQVLQSATSDAESHPLFGGLRTSNFFILPYRAILNLRPTFPSGGIDITDMISEFENEAFVGFQEILLLRFFTARFKVWDGPPGPQHGSMGRKSAFSKCRL